MADTTEVTPTPTEVEKVEETSVEQTEQTEQSEQTEQTEQNDQDSARAKAQQVVRPVSGSLYVGDLDQEVGESLLFETFKQVGPVASIRVCRDAVTRRSLGYAYVNFHNVKDAERALNTLNYSLINGRPCRIMWSVRDPSLRKSNLGNIFIKGLDKSIDNKALYDTFSTFGNILSCKVELNEDQSSRGFGYVHYETEEAAEEAIKNVNGMMLNGVIVSVTKFVPRKDRQTVNPEQSFKNVYVKNIPTSYSDEDFKNLVSKHGAVNSAVVMRQEDGTSRGFGFVDYASHEEAAKAVDELNGSTVNDKELFACRAQKKAEREAKLREKYKKLKQERITKYQDVNLYIKNLEDGLDLETLKREFSQFGTITSAKIMEDENGVSKGFGFVCFAKPEEAAKAVTEMNNKMLLSKPLYVALAQPIEVRRAQLEAQHAQRMPPTMPMAMGYGPPVYPYMQPQRSSYMYPQMMRPQQQRWTQRPYQIAVPAYVVPGNQRRKGNNSNNNNNNNNNYPNGRKERKNKNANRHNTNPRGEQIMLYGGDSEQKQMIGNTLYQLVHRHQPVYAGKITGMLLESCENSMDLQPLINDNNLLQDKIKEALVILKRDEGLN